MGALFLPWRARALVPEERAAGAPWFDNFGTIASANASEPRPRVSRLRAWRERRPTDLTAHTSASSSLRSADAAPQAALGSPGVGMPASPTFLGWRWPRMSSVDRRQAQPGSSLSVMRCFIPAPEPESIAERPLAAVIIDEDMRKALAE